MVYLVEEVRGRVRLDEAARPQIARLLVDWQILADLSFADLVLWFPDKDDDGYWATAHIRPTTGPTAFPEDIVGTHSAGVLDPVIDEAFTSVRIVRKAELTTLQAGLVRVEAIPVTARGSVVGVISRNTNPGAVRTPSRLERAYLKAATELAKMIAAGVFPGEGERGDRVDSVRVGDGFIRLGTDGRVCYASPNAQSVYRKLGFRGDLDGVVLADITRSLIPEQPRMDAAGLSAVLTGRHANDAEVGNAEATMAARSIPLAPAGVPTGALVLVRDVTDLRRRDRELVTKDATIREIHHRVKNNLQTVSALLRLQGRRLREPEGRIALDEAVRRVAAIAVVHEILSQSFDEVVAFDDVADQLAHLIVDVGGRGGVEIVRGGSIGVVGSDIATPLALVLTELMQNAVQHGYAGCALEPALDRDGISGSIRLTCDRDATMLKITLEDDGVGLPANFDLEQTNSLGLSIVQTLLADMGGTLKAYTGTSGGAVMHLELPDVCKTG